MCPVRSPGLQRPQKPFRIIVGRVTSRGVWMQFLIFSHLPLGEGGPSAGGPGGAPEVKGTGVILLFTFV